MDGPNIDEDEASIRVAIRDPFEIDEVRYPAARFRLVLATTADLIAIVTLAAAGLLKDSPFLVVAAVIVASMVLSHTDLLYTWCRRQLSKMFLYDGLHLAYQSATRSASQTQARLLLLQKNPAVEILGTTVKDQRVHLVLATKDRRNREAVEIGHVYAVIQEVRLEVWGLTEIIEIAGGRAYARVVDYTQNPVFWGLLESRKEYDASIPGGLLAVKVE